MKKPIALLLLVSFFAGILILPGSCKHEIPNSCYNDPLTLSVTKTDAAAGQNNGIISALATGGSKFQYSLNGGAYQDTGYFTGLNGSQTYNIVVKNSYGCTDTAQIDIGSIDPCSGVTIAVNTAKTDASPNQSNGSISATATGGSGFTFSLGDGLFQPGGSFTGLAAGNYTVNAKNSNGCTGTTQVTIGTNNPCAGITVAVTTTKTDPTANQSNGSITATATGGSGFTYSLNSGAYQSSGSFTGLATGNYTITAKNSNGCTGVAQVALGATDPCAGITVAVTTTKVDPTTNQSNGSITATATGGSGFTYSLNSGAYQSGGSFTGLATGNYTITAKNSNGCTGVTQVALGSTNPCAGITVAVTTAKVDPTTNQSNGSITATATGGSGFTYSLNNGAYQSSGSFTGLAAGNYTVTAKNSNGCLGVAQVALVSTNPCTGVTITVSLTSVNPSSNQNNGSITAVASGATGFTYSLNNGAYQSSGSFTNLAAGNYTVTAKSSAGCLGTATATLTTVNACTNTNIILTATTVDVVPCSSPANNGSISASASGSSGYTYNINSGAYQASGTFSNLPAGTYTIGVKDINGCTNTASVTVATKASGPLLAAVKALLTTRCSGSGCHTNGGSAAGYNFDTDCNIISNWNKINSSAVTNGSMPKSPQSKLTAAEKQKITDWVNAGHAYAN